MEPDCKALIDKYVRSDSVIACLELSGYTSALLIRNLDSNQIDQIEEFVRHACTVMNPNQARSFLGNVFSCHSDKFCFPIGVRMGLMLAVNELKSLTGSISGSGGGSATTVPSPEKSSQTDISIGCSPTLPSSFVNPLLPPLVPHKTPPHATAPHDLLSCSSTPKSSSIDHASDSATESQEKPPHHHHHHHQKGKFDLSLRLLGSCESHSTDRSSSGAPAIDGVNIEHLKQHSSASAIRLAARQFVNAHLVANRHFRIDMEVGATADGAARVTGIFSCHLCRQKRDRSTPVRFSIARNRYPVMSNVLSHLKIHFQPLLGAPGQSGGGGAERCDGEAADGAVAALQQLQQQQQRHYGQLQQHHHPQLQQHQSQQQQQQHFIKQENRVGNYSQSDSSVGVDSLSPFNLDHLIMAGGGGGGGGSGGGSEMKMFPSVADK